MSDNEGKEARALLGSLLQDEPPVTIDSRELVRKGRRHTVVIRSATIGTVALAVVGVVFLTTLVRPTPDDTAALPLASAVPTPCALPSAACPVVPMFTEDSRSRALTKALQESTDKFIPAGLTAKSPPGSWYGGGIPVLTVMKTANGALQRPQWPYFASAEVGNDRDGFGSLAVYVNDKGTDGRCTSPSAPPLRNVTLVHCADTTLPGGTKAALSRYVGRDDVPMTGNESYREVTVDAARPDGTRVHVVTTNRTVSLYGHQQRAEPPLSDKDLFTIVELPGVKY